jgi:hypothetical protein
VFDPREWQAVIVAGIIHKIEVMLFVVMVGVGVRLKKLRSVILDVQALLFT